MLALTRWDAAFLGRHLDFEPSWRSLIAGFLLLGNWHLLWYAAIALAVLGSRRLIRGEQEGGAVIGVNSMHAPVRRRFSIGHELGHHLLRHAQARQQLVLR